MRDRSRGRLLALASAAACLAVLGGGAASASAAAGPAGHATTTGSWTIQSTYYPKKAAPKAVALQQVSCSAANACLAIGRTGAYRFLSETWNGTTWTPKLTVLPAGGGTLNDVSCSAATACTAVGLGYSGTSEVNLVERWNGTSWQQQTAPTPAGGTAPGMTGVSCPGNQSCIAVGGYSTGTNTNATLAESWNGTSWSVQPMPATGYTQSSLYDVSCPTATDCVAVGYQTNNILKQSTVLAESWNGTSWTIQKTPAMPASEQADLGKVSCSAASSCTALGSYEKNGKFLTLVEHWNGTSWGTVPGLAADLSPGSLSCPAATSCTGVGFRTAHGHAVAAIAVYWNGTTWTSQGLPYPAGTIGHSIDPQDVSCPTTSGCEMVGFYGAKTGTGTWRDKTIIEGN